YNDALTSKSDFSTKPTLCPQHIDEFDLKDETSLSEYDEVEKNVSYFNVLFPFNIVYPDDLKSDKGNDNNKIDMIQSLGNLYVPFGIPFDPKRYYKDGDCARKLRRPRIGDEMRLDVAGTICFQLGGARRTISGGRATPEKEAINAKGRKSGASQVAAAGAPEAAEDAIAVDEGAQADPAPGLRKDVRSLYGLVETSMTEQGSSLTIFKRRTSQRTSKASTSAASQQPDL
ncbi:hypothetical protein Tco_1524977, partial [Tanacetum coccineum]